MTTLENPTAGQVKEYCAMMERSLLDALNMGARVVLKTRTHTKELFSPAYGRSPTDMVYTGRKYVAELTLEAP